MRNVYIDKEFPGGKFKDIQDPNMRRAIMAKANTYADSTANKSYMNELSKEYRTSLNAILPSLRNIKDIPTLGLDVLSNELGINLKDYMIGKMGYLILK